jgi:hypothetical protein
MSNSITGDRGESPWVIAGTVAGVVGAVAAAAVFILPSADSRTDDTQAVASSGAGSSSTKEPGTITAPETSLRAAATGAAADGRSLSTLSPEIGAGSIQVTGQDIAIPCPSNQSDDTEREFGYALPSAFSNLSTRVTLTGPADRDATASVQVFIKRRQDRSDRIPEVGRAVVTSSIPAAVDAPLSTAVAVRLRVRCASPDQTVHLISPRITR